MKKINDGGPAFPSTYKEIVGMSAGVKIDPGDQYVEGQPIYEEIKSPGMTLRDYFAAKAMQASMSVESTNEWLKDSGNRKEVQGKLAVIAEGAYMLAEAMLKARDND
jgi:hypothetical protein